MLRRTRFGLALVLAFVSFGTASASPWANVADPVFQRIDTKGLPHPAVYAIAQDTEGFLWIGTPAGLARYDGYRFKNYSNATDASAPAEAQTLLADPRGGLWIGTTSSGLAHLDTTTQTFRTWRADANGRTGPRSATVVALARTADGRLWIGGDGGLDAFDPRTERFARMRLAPSDAQPRVEALLVDRAQTVWVATLRGIYYRTAGAPAFRQLTSTPAFSLQSATDGSLWAGTLNAVLRFDRHRHLVHRFASSTDPASLAPGETWAIAEPTAGIMWAGSSDGGVSSIDVASGHVRRIPVDRANPAGLTPGAVWQFFRDRSGLMWIANGSGGLLSYNPRTTGIYEIMSDAMHLGTGGLGARALAAASNGALWLGGADRLAQIDPQSGAVYTFAVPNRRSIQTLFDNQRDTLWVGTLNGLCELSPPQTGVLCPRGFDATLGRVFAVVETGRALWIGTASGVVKLDKHTQRVLHLRHGANVHTLSNDFVNVLYADRSGTIWAGTSNGLNRIDPTTDVVTRYVHDDRNANSLGAGSIASLLEDRNGRLWIGAVGGSLSILTFDRDVPRFQRLTEANGLPSQDIDGLGEDPHGAIWASAVNVVARIDPVSLRASVYTAADGVQEAEYWTRAVSHSRDGTLFFGGTTGVTVIAPGAASPWSFAPPLVVTSLDVSRRGGRDLTAEFASLDYSAPDALLYQYKLDGYDRDWIAADSSHRIATYTNLGPGSYTLRARGTNRNGVWSPHVLALRVVVEPAWYETWWFRILVLLAAIATIFGAHQARTATLRRRQRRLEAIVDARTRELSEANAKLEEMSLTDPLTGFRNRRFLEQHLEADIAATLRSGKDLLFFMVDIDHFKAVNDDYGHRAGDLVLIQMRERLAEVFRESDFVVRWGGEEFLAVARSATRADAPDIAERVRRAVADRPFILDDGRTLAKTASIGFAAFPFVPNEPHAVNWQQVVALADRALYIAKSDGRNRWHGITGTSGAEALDLVRGAYRGS